MAVLTSSSGDGGLRRWIALPVERLAQGWRMVASSALAQPKLNVEQLNGGDRRLQRIKTTEERPDFADFDALPT